MRVWLALFTMLFVVGRAHIQQWLPTVKFLHPPRNSDIVKSASTKFLSIQFNYRVLIASNHWEGVPLRIRLFERHAVDPGNLETTAGEPIHVVLTEPGTYAFELILIDAATNQELSRDWTVFNIVGDYAADFRAGIPPAFDSRANVYDYLGTPIANSMPVAPIRSRSSLKHVESVSGYYESLPETFKSLVRPTEIVLVGGVNPPFDGTKQFILQYETIVDRKLVAFTHMDMINDAETGDQHLMAKMLKEANIPLQYVRISIQLKDYASAKIFMRAGHAMARFRSWCDASPRMNHTLAHLLPFLAQFDGMWRINHDPDEEYLQQSMRLADPASFRVNDFVSRMDLPCRYRRQTPPSSNTSSGFLPWNERLSMCTQEAAEMGAERVSWRAWIKPDCDYVNEHFEADMTALYDRPEMLSTTSDGVLFRTKDVDRIYTKGAQDLDRDVTLEDSWKRFTHFQPSSYEMLVGPSHYVAQNEHIKSYYQPVTVVPGLNSRKVVVGPKRVADVCKDIWGELGNINTTVVAFIGRVAREKGMGLYLKAIHLLRDKTPPNTLFVVIGGAGDQPYGALMQRLAEELGIAPSIRFLGFTKPKVLMDWYANACIDVVVTPYLRPASESFGLVLIEAMEAKLPVVHFGIGGMQDYTRNMSNSVLSACSNAHCLADAISLLVHNETLRKQIGARGAAFVTNNLRYSDTAMLLEVQLRSEHVASKLLRGNIPGGLKEAFSHHLQCNNDHFAQIIAPITWHELKHAAPNFVQVYAGRTVPLKLIERVGSTAEWQLQPSRKSAHQWQVDVIFTPKTKISEGSSSSKDMDGLEFAQRLVSGFPDILCKQQLENPSIPCTVEHVLHNAIQLLQPRILATTSLCWWYQNGATNCAQLLDIAHTTSRTNSSLHVLSMHLSIPVQPVLLALVENRMPHVVLAATFASV